MFVNKCPSLFAVSSKCSYDLQLLRCVFRLRFIIFAHPCHAWDYGYDFMRLLPSFALIVIVSEISIPSIGHNDERSNKEVLSLNNVITGLRMGETMRIIQSVQSIK